MNNSELILVINGDYTMDNNALSYLHLNLNILQKVSDNYSLPIEKTNYTPQIGDKLYFLPGVNIPRVKLKELILNYNIKSVKDIEEATVIFGGKNSESKLIKSSWYYNINTEDFKNCIDVFRPILDKKLIENLDTIFQYYTHRKVYGPWNIIQLLCDDSITQYKSFMVNPGSIAKLNRSSSNVYHVEEEYSELFKSLEHKTVIHEGSLLDKLNGDDAIIITEEVFEQICNMFDSSDEANHILAMEIMANSNYSESLLYIHFLFKEYYSEIYNCPTKNHVNFKSLLSYLNKDRYSFESTLDQIVNSLAEKGVLTSEKIDILLTKYHKEIQDTGSTGIFKVKTITLDEVILSSLNLNYEFKVLDEFTPVEIETPEEIPEEPTENIKWI
jgi:hypothetical protein